MCGDRFRNTAGRDGEEVSRTADPDAVIAYAERLRARGADQIEGDLDLIVAAEIAFPADDRSALQQIAGAIRRPGVPDIVVPSKDEDTGRPQHLDRRQSKTARALGDESDAGFCHCLGGNGRLPLGDIAEAKAVADRDLAAEAQGFRPGTDLMDIEQPHFARLVQMDIEPDAMPRSDGKDAVELPLRVAVDFQGVYAANQVGAGADRRFEEV